MCLKALLPVKRSRLSFAALALTLAIGCLAWWLAASQGRGQGAGEAAQDRPQLGLVTSLPIYWGEAGDLSAMLEQQESPHWVRSALEKRYVLAPLDQLAQADRTDPSLQLAGLKFLMLAQPSALPPADLVALDSWVRGGGRVLLFADPLLTQDSQFAHGDQRRPADTTMIDPLLARWGLSLSFDPAQPKGRQMRALGLDGGVTMPVNMAGRLALVSGQSEAEAGDRCTIGKGGLAAQCRIGEGQALVLADAAMLEAGGHGAGAPDNESRGALNGVTRLAFGR